MRQERFQLVIPKWLKDELKQAADEKGVSMSDFIKDTLKSSLPSSTFKKAAKNEPESNAD